MLRGKQSPGLTAAGVRGQRLAAGIAGAAILLDALAARLLLRADVARVYLLNRSLDLTCAFRRSTGLPCPTCGISRSMVLALSGRMSLAWTLAPVGPLLVFGALALALTLVLFACGSAPWAPARAWFWIRRGGLLYAAVTLAVWLGGWIAQFWTAWHALALAFVSK